MIDTRKQRLIFILTTISLGISTLVFIPFGSTSFHHAEALIKLVFLPLIVLVLNIIIATNKFRDYRPTDRFSSFASYIPVMGYFVAICVYLVFVITRGMPTSCFTHQKYVMVLLTLGIEMMGILMCLFLFDRLAIKLTKFSIVLIDIAIMVAFEINVLVFNSKIAKPYESVNLVNFSKWHVFALIVLAAIFFVSLFLRLKHLYVGKEEFTSKDKDELLAKWQAQRDTEYFNGEFTILYSLVNYSSDRLSINLYGEDETKKAKESSAKVQELQQRLREIQAKEALEKSRSHKMALAYADLKNKVKIEVATTELDAAKKQLEVIQDGLEKNKNDYQADLTLYEEEKTTLEEKMAVLEKEKEEVAAKIKPVEEPTPTPVSAPVEKKEKVFAYPYEELVQFAQGLDHADLSVAVNPKGTQHKFLVAGKPYLITQKTTSDYRITFFVEDAKLLDYLQGYPGLISVANTPKDGNWLKIVNKGELEEAFIKTLVSESLPAELAYEQAKIEAKEAARRAKEAAKEEERLNNEKVRMAEKILADNEKEAARQAKEAEREAIRQAKEAEREAARQAREAERAAREAERQAKEAAKEAERQAKEEALRQAKEAELKAKEEELKAREAELQATAEEEEAKRQAEREKAEQARKEAEEAAEKAKREAEEAAERAKREAEEHAEKVRKEAEKAAEKARKEAEAHAEKTRKEAEREAARKAKEAEKIVKDAEKARKEAEREAARKAKEAEKLVKNAEKEAEEAAEQARKEAEEAAEKARKEAEEAAEKARKEAEEEAARILEEAKKKAEAEQSNLEQSNPTLVEAVDNDEKSNAEPKAEKKATTAKKAPATKSTTAKKAPATKSTAAKKTTTAKKSAAKPATAEKKTTTAKTATTAKKTSTTRSKKAEDKAA